MVRHSITLFHQRGVFIGGCHHSGESLFPSSGQQHRQG